MKKDKWDDWEGIDPLGLRALCIYLIIGGIVALNQFYHWW